MSALVEFKDVSKVFQNDVVALSHVHFSVNEGEFVAIMGPSGSGKSTLLNILSALLKPTSGEVLMSDENISQLEDEKINEWRSNHIGFVYQDFCLLDSLTVQENLALPLGLLGLSKKEIKQRIETTTKSLDIYSLIKKYPIQCSGGQQQRMAIARALITKPDLILADEPTGNLDSERSLDIMETFDALNQQGHTIIMVTHDSHVASFANRVICLKDGHIEKELMKNQRSNQAFLDEIVAYYATDIWG